MQMVDVHLPTSDGRELVLSRYTQPGPEHRMLLNVLKLRSPEQPRQSITARQVLRRNPAPLWWGPAGAALTKSTLRVLRTRELRKIG